MFLKKLLIELITKYLVFPTVNAVKADILKLNVEIMNSIKPKFDFKEVDFKVVYNEIKNPHRSMVRMLLKLLAYDEQDELLPVKWEIEHILPVKYQSNYFFDIDHKIIKEKVETIGNKIPFEKKLNIMEYMKSNGILTVFHYIPLHSAPAGPKFGRFHGEDVYTTKESERLVRLPMYYGIDSKDLEFVIDSVKVFYQN